MQEKCEETPTSNPALSPKRSRALLSQRVEAHLIAPNHCWFTTRVRGIVHKRPINQLLLKSTFLMCNISFLPGYRHVISLSACLVLLCWNPLINPLQSQGRFFLLSHKQGLSRLHSLRSKHAYIPFPKNQLHMFAVFTSLTRNINTDLTLQRHTTFIIFHIVTDQLNAEWVW